MADWLTFTVHITGVGELNCVITEQIAREMLQEAWRYEFEDPALSDRQKVERMVSTQLALAFEKGRAREGTFVLDDVDGRKWLVPNENLLAASIDTGEPATARTALGFHQLAAPTIRVGDAPGS